MAKKATNTTVDFGDGQKLSLNNGKFTSTVNGKSVPPTAQDTTMYNAAATASNTRQAASKFFGESGIYAPILTPKKK